MTLFDPVPLTIGFAVVVFTVCWLGDAAVTGWRRLARIYPDQPFEAEKSFNFVSGEVGGFVRFKGALRVDVGAAGMRISVWPSFRQPLIFLVPWVEITVCRRQRHFLAPEGIRFELRRWDKPIRLANLWREKNFVEEILSRWIAAKQCATPDVNSMPSVDAATLDV